MVPFNLYESIKDNAVTKQVEKELLDIVANAFDPFFGSTIVVTLSKEKTVAQVEETSLLLRFNLRVTIEQDAKSIDLGFIDLSKAIKKNGIKLFVVKPENFILKGVFLVPLAFDFAAFVLPEKAKKPEEKSSELVQDDQSSVNEDIDSAFEDLEQ